MSDMRETIVAKSDQLNADDLIGQELTIKITGVKIKSDQEQRVWINYEGDNGKPYKACKSMCRVMVAAWGIDSSKYVGRSMTLYRNPNVKWANEAVGGIRISHMSDIESDMTIALTVTRGNKKPYTVRKLNVAQPQNAADFITADQALALESRCTENGITLERLRKAAGVEKVSLITADKFQQASEWIDKVIAKAKSG